MAVSDNKDSLEVEIMINFFIQKFSKNSAKN